MRSCKKNLKLLQTTKKLTKRSRLFFESHIDKKMFIQDWDEIM